MYCFKKKDFIIMLKLIDKKRKLKYFKTIFFNQDLVSILH